jgi:hypothetical protein
MSKLGTKLRRMKTAVAHWCPGCSEMHVIHVDAPNASGARWTWDGNIEKPTFQPSINIRINPPDHPHYQPQAMTSICHYFLHGGNLQFLGDCTYHLKGRTVPLPDLPEVP